jgi:pyruvate/2-oxoglutarate dehydrogenase complex dihydrolipoamide dehydrogenase (E3) component
LPLEHVDPAVAVGTERGFVKLVAAPKRVVGHLGGGRLVGATVVAPTGGDLVHEAALATHCTAVGGEHVRGEGGERSC